MMQSLQFKSFGQPEEVMELVELPLPALESGQVQVRVLASAINPADINYVQGYYGVKPELPSTCGIEGVAEVLDSQSELFQAGDRVIFIKRVGTWQQELICSADSLVKIPQELAVEQAAMLKVNPLTALQLLTSFLDLKAGDWIIQNAANSGVGQSLIQLAQILGIKTINIVRREEALAEIIDLGGDINLVDAEDLKSQVLELTNGVEPQLAMNAVGGDSALRLMDCLAPKGQHVTYGAMSLRSLKVPNKFLIFKGISLHGLWVTEWLSQTPYEKIQQTYQQLADYVIAGKLSQPVAATYPLAKHQQALTHAQQPKRGGKILFVN